MRGMKRILVTGAAGFAGLHLARELGCRGWTVHGLVRKLTQIPALKAVGAKPILGDLTREADLRRAVRLAEPEACAHLAAGAFVPDAEKDPPCPPRSSAARASKPPSCRMPPPSSPRVWSMAREAPLPTNPRSRPGQPTVAQGRGGDARPEAIIARPFNYAGPGQDPRFVVSALARQVARSKPIQSETMQGSDLGPSFATSATRPAYDLLSGGCPPTRPRDLDPIRPAGPDLPVRV